MIQAFGLFVGIIGLFAVFAVMDRYEAGEPVPAGMLAVPIILIVVAAVLVVLGVWMGEDG